MADAVCNIKYNSQSSVMPMYLVPFHSGTTQPSASPLLDKKGKKFIQQVCGNVLFLCRAVGSTLLWPISAITSQSATPTEETMRQTHQLLDYIVTQEDSVITYTNSNMKLAVHSDASYLSKTKARSRAGGPFFLSGRTLHTNFPYVTSFLLFHGMSFLVMNAIVLVGYV